MISLLPPQCNLALYAGDGVAIRLTVQYKDGTPYPLDGGTVYASIRHSRIDPDPPLLAFNVDTTDAAGGIVILGLAGADTQTLLGGLATFSGVWDAQFQPTGADPKTLIQGTVSCVADVTRA